MSVEGNHIFQAPIKGKDLLRLEILEDGGWRTGQELSELMNLQWRLATFLRKINQTAASIPINQAENLLWFGDVLHIGNLVLWP